MRLIDIDALSHEMYHQAFETDSDMQKWDGGCWIRYKMFEKCRDNAPTIDAEPVRHGRWETRFSRPIVYADLCCHCSVCGYADDYQYAIRYYHYCPNCGATMDEERRTNNGEQTL